MYGADIRSGRPNIAGAKLKRAMLLRVLFNIRS